MCRVQYLITELYSNTLQYVGFVEIRRCVFIVKGLIRKQTTASRVARSSIAVPSFVRVRMIVVLLESRRLQTKKIVPNSCFMKFPFCAFRVNTQKIKYFSMSFYRVFFFFEQTVFLSRTNVFPAYIRKLEVETKTLSFFFCTYMKSYCIPKCRRKSSGKLAELN